jgi:hypothetical protein
MSQIVRTITRYESGLTVYGNDGCVRSARATGHLRLASTTAPSLKPGLAVSASNRALASKLGYPVSASASLEDLALEPAARTFCFWLEDQYEGGQAASFGAQHAPIKVRDMPPKEVVDMAVAMLRQRGWVVIPPVVPEGKMSGPRTGLITMKLVNF